MPLNKGRRAFILVMDSFGLGAAPDADKFGDVGADTFGHIVRECAAGKADKEGVRQGSLYIPNLLALGLGEAHYAATGERVKGLPIAQSPGGMHGAAAEISAGKDTPSGHWEMAGVPVTFDWGMFPAAEPSFPKALTDALIEQAGLPGILGNKHSSGTDILNELGEEHIKTGKPIVYTSADSVFQIAAHEEHFGLERLYQVCKIARKLVDEYNVGRVIARPFVGEKSGAFKRTGNRKDLAVPPPSATVLEKLSSTEGGSVISIGKIGDIFAHIGTGTIVKATGNEQIMEKTIDAVQTAPDGCLVVSNFVDFDMEYGHRRDVVGYANALEAFDRRLPEIIHALKDGDLVFLTADHGCDPTWKGSDHTREYVPVIAFGPNIAAQKLGCLKTFADIGQTVAAHLGVEAMDYGTNLFDLLPEETHERIRKTA